MAAVSASQPLYGHAYNAPGDFSDAQYAQIASTFPLFTVEKRHAWGVYGNASAPASSPLRSNSIAASVGTARKIHALNESVRVLMYWNSALSWQMYECEVDVKPSWLLPPKPPATAPRYNYAVADFRRWWVQCAVDALLGSGGALGGLFLDAEPKLYDTDQPADALALWGGMVDSIHAAVPGSYLIFNGLYNQAGKILANASLLAHADAVYVEDLASLGDAATPLPPPAAAAYLGAIAHTAAAAAAAGKAVVGHGFAPPVDLHDTTFMFSFATWLLVTAGGAQDLFLANDGYSIAQGVLTRHAAYALDLGAPLGAFSAPNATALQREFARATVTVDLKKRVGVIVMLA